MNRFLLLLLAAGIWGWLFCRPLAASEAELQSQILQLQEQMRTMEKRHQRELGAMRREINSLQSSSPGSASAKLSGSLLDAEAPASSTPGTAPTTNASSGDWSRAPEPEFGRLLQSEDGQAWIDLALIGTFSAGTSTGNPSDLELGGHDPHRRGFNVQGVELSLSGAVDPYFKAQATILFGLDGGGETYVEIEEAWMETTALPWNLKLKGGQMLTQFGRLNPTHLHSWDFVDSPLVNARFLGPDGLRGPGGQISWLLPAPFYSEFFFSVQNAPSEHDHAHGDHAHEEEIADEDDAGAANFRDMLFAARWASSFDLSPAQTVLGGVSMAYGPNEFNRNTTVLGADLTWKWKPVWASKGFPFVKWQTEGMLRFAEATENGGGGGHAHEEEEHHDDEEGHDDHEEHEEEEHAGGGGGSGERNRTYTDWGLYSQVVWGFTENWTLGFRGEYAKGFERFDEPTRWRLSPALTFYPSEFSKLRLQYNFDRIPSDTESEHSVWLQFEFLLGAHGAHEF